LSGTVSVVIPTYGREKVLVDTISSFLGLGERLEEILVVDQTPAHEEETTTALQRWNDGGAIRWVRLDRASIPAAMNAGLRASSCELVLFLDDDIVPRKGLVEAHRRAQAMAGVVGVTGMVLQPGETPTERDESKARGKGLRRDLAFPFTSTQAAEICNVMAGNLSVKREAALACGGFDERFVGVAYRFETEFCRRLRRHGGRVVYEPTAVIDHLKARAGGTRAWGFHKTSARGEHSVGDYYFAFLEGKRAEVWSYVGYRLLSECLSRFHRARPWHIPAKAIGEVRGLAMAMKLVREKRAEKKGQVASE
jgi:GT2 family glycosyltransferase